MAASHERLPTCHYRALRIAVRALTACPLQCAKCGMTTYDILEATLKQDGGDITPWLLWLFNCLDRANAGEETTLATALKKAKLWELHPVANENERQCDITKLLLNCFEVKLNTLKWAKIQRAPQTLRYSTSPKGASSKRKLPEVATRVTR